MTIYILTTRPALSPNFGAQYPALHKSLDELKLLDAPKCLSLGQQGRYFANIGSKKLWRLPQSIERYLGNVSDCEAVWLGQGETYVAVKKGGGCSTDLKGKNEGLKEAF